MVVGLFNILAAYPARRRVNGRAFLLAVMVGVALMGSTVAIAADEVGPGCRISPAENDRAVGIFARMLPVLQHPRCANCHGKIDVFSPAAAELHGGDKQDDLNDCKDCHTRAADLVRQRWVPKAPGHDLDDALEAGTWRPPSSAIWGNLSKDAICLAIKDTRRPGAAMLKHLHDDLLVALGLEGRRGVTRNTIVPAPPPMSQASFLALMQEWMSAMEAGEEWPESPMCGCLPVAAMTATKEALLKNELRQAMAGTTLAKKQKEAEDADDRKHAEQEKAQRQAALARHQAEEAERTRADQERAQREVALARHREEEAAAEHARVEREQAQRQQVARAAADADCVRKKGVMSGFDPATGNYQCTCPQGLVVGAGNVCVSQRDLAVAECKKQGMDLKSLDPKTGHGECACALGMVIGPGGACVSQRVLAEAECNKINANLKSVDPATGHVECQPRQPTCPAGTILTREGGGTGAAGRCLTKSELAAAYCENQNNKLRSFDETTGRVECEARQQTPNGDRSACYARCRPYGDDTFPSRSVLNCLRQCNGKPPL